MNFTRLKNRRCGTEARSCRCRLHGERARGFTLVELLVALSVGAILMALAIPFYIGYMDRARTIRAIAEIKLIAQQLEAYAEENNDSPPDSLV